MTPKRNRKHPAFDTEFLVITAVSGFISGYLLFSGWVPAAVLRLFIVLDIYVFTVLALWCVLEWMLPRCMRAWHDLQARSCEEAERAALSDLISECVLEQSRAEHQGRDTSYLIVRDENQELYLLSPADPAYTEVARVLVRGAETYPASAALPDDESGELPFSEVIGGLGNQVTVRDTEGRLRVLGPADPGYKEAVRVVVERHPYLAVLFQEADDPSSVPPDDSDDDNPLAAVND
jgi:hypothetical protein